MSETSSQPQLKPTSAPKGERPTAKHKTPARPTSAVRKTTNALDKQRSQTSSIGGIPVDQFTVSFCQAALELKSVTAQQIREAVQIRQAFEKSSGRVPPVDELFGILGFLTPEQIAKIKRYREVHKIADKIPGFSIAEKIGQGAMGAVYKAKQVRLDRWVAIKVLLPELAANESWRNRFLKEARAAARLNHPNIIAGIDAGMVGSLCYFAMEYVEGKTLHDMIKAQGPMDEGLALGIAHQIGLALEHASAHNLVHRDIKPDNIMMNTEQVAKLLDLGLAKVMMSEQTASMTRGMAVGTPNFISPEQAMGQSDVDVRADIYSLGATLYAVLAGQPPYSGPPEVVMYRHIHEPVPDLLELRPDLSQFTVDLCNWMMAKQREYRPQTATELVDKIGEALSSGIGGATASRSNSSSRSGISSRPAPNAQSAGRLPTPRGGQRQRKQAQGGRAPAKDQGSEQDAPRMPKKRRRNFGSDW